VTNKIHQIHFQPRLCPVPLGKLLTLTQITAYVTPIAISSAATQYHSISRPWSTFQIQYSCRPTSHKL